MYRKNQRDFWRCIGKIRVKSLTLYRKKSVKFLAAYRCIKRDPLRCIEKSERPLAVYRKNKRDPGGIYENSERPLAAYRKK